MNINFTNLEQARAAARLKHNIKRLNRHEDKKATMEAYGNDISVRIDFANGTTIGENFKAENLEAISNFCNFLEGSETKEVAALSSLTV
jgi:hypothetical protein